MIYISYIRKYTVHFTVYTVQCNLGSCNVTVKCTLYTVQGSRNPVLSHHNSKLNDEIDILQMFNLGISS